ncbi:MAG: protein phosphatase 2C domain-containing protein, partial [Pirellulales bacterium]|nr:protein phosphatase 2C domain-containing protein [Pirellulales bacterium]
MKFRSKSFWLAKDPQHGGEYQDAHAVDEEQGRAAIADGVSSAIFSRRWAEILTQRCVESPPTEQDLKSLNDWLVEPRKEWAATIDPSKLAWHQRSKLKGGAFTTMLLACLADTPDADLSVWAIGDCNLFHIRQGELLRSFPMDTVEQFSADPLVIGSIDANRDQFLELKAIDLPCTKGDQFVLCTDAIGCWAMAEYEAGRTVDWGEFWSLTDDA